MSYEDQTADDIIAGFTESFEFDSGSEAVDHVLNDLLKKEYKDLIEFPYGEMNKKLTGIFPTSFVVIGSDYGGGKSELCGDIALHAASDGKRVIYFDFENDDGDFVMRQMCKKMSKKLKRSFAVTDLKTTDIENGEYADQIYKCSAELADDMKGIQLYRNNRIPGIEEFIEKLEDISDTDLICIDHLHYFNMEDSEDEKRSIGKIMRELRRITKVKRIPVVLVSHLTKRDKKRLPTGSDFYGSSNIAKEAKTCILLHRDDEQGCTMVIDKNRDGRGTCKLDYIYDFKNSRFDFSPSQGFTQQAW